MSLADTIIILVGALVLFGPKKLPELARQLGKIMGELRRASNEFRFQMEEELRQSEQADKVKAATSSSASAPAILPPAEGVPVANKISSRAVTNPPTELEHEATPRA